MIKKYLRNRLCIAVQGVNRSVIYDLLRGDYHFIPNEIYEIIHTSETITCSQFTVSGFKSEWFDFLIEHEFLFEINGDGDVKNFPEIDKTYMTTYDISNLLIHDNYCPNLLNLWSNFSIKNLTILSENFQPQVLECLLENLTELEIDCITIVLTSKKREYYYSQFDFLRKFDNVFSIFCFESTLVNDRTQYKHRLFEFILIDHSFEQFCNNVYPEKFHVNHEIFLESINHNLFFHKQVYVDQELKIKNGLTTKIDFGSILDLNSNQIQSILISNQFRRHWEIPKNQILVCNQCEFRLMCPDPKPVKKVSDNLYVNVYECNYNPYISLWSFEEGYLNLKDSGVDLKNNDSVIRIDKPKLSRIVSQIWER